MIEVQQKNNQVILRVDVHPIGYYFNFTYDAGSEWAAKALFKILNEALMERVRGIRKDEYELGLKDARKLKKDRKDWFSGWLVK
jgi:hypothetical protein